MIFKTVDKFAYRTVYDFVSSMNSVIKKIKFDGYDLGLPSFYADGSLDVDVAKRVLILGTTRNKGKSVDADDLLRDINIMINGSGDEYDGHEDEYDEYDEDDGYVQNVEKFNIFVEYDGGIYTFGRPHLSDVFVVYDD